MVCIKPTNIIVYASLFYDTNPLFSRVEKYRPDSLEEVKGQQEIVDTVRKFVETGNYHIYYFMVHQELVKHPPLLL